MAHDALFAWPACCTFLHVISMPAIFLFLLSLLGYFLTDTSL